MKKIPIFSTVESTISAITNASQKVSKKQISTFKILNEEHGNSVLCYELPEIKIMDFGDKNTNVRKYMQIIENDPWLLFGGVIAIVDKNSQKLKLEEEKNPNFLLVITRKDFESHAEKIIKILLQNEKFLYSRRLHIDTNELEEDSFICENDIFELKFYAALLVTYLYNTNRLNEISRNAFYTSLNELLFNALEHGNCEITYEEKNNWLAKGKDIVDLIAEKCKNPNIKNKRIVLSYAISKKTTKISIKDEGKGFDWKKKLDSDFKAGLNGIGIKMSQSLVKNIRYNDIGNEVFFEIDNQQNIANLTPAILLKQSIVTYKHMQIVCLQGEESENLFYICSGRFAVYVSNKLLRVLTPQDIFVGEMAFLLDNKRTATIVSIGEGRLIKIDKTKFIKLIEKYPHYGIFIAKLLAQRLEKQSKDSSNLKTKISQMKEQISNM